MEIKETLTKRVGPLPIWGWGAVVIGGVGVFLIMRRRSSSTATAQPDLGSSSAGGGGAGGGSGGGAGGGNGGGGDSAVPPAGDHTNPTPTATPTQPDGGGAPTAPPRPLTEAEQTAVREHRATPDIAAKIIANNLAGTIDFVSRQVQRAGDTGISANSGALGATPSQLAAEREQIATALRQRGYVASTWGGQIYAGRDSASFFRALPRDAQAALIRLINAQKAAA